MNKNLVYDVGMNNGDDTAYYLFRGFNVIAIEADPSLVQAAKIRFANEIESGALTILNVGIGPKNESKEFWICDDHSEWNSFDRNIASRDGLKHHAINVQCKRFEELLQEFSIPYYLKVDIEGHDHYCLEALGDELPQHLSFELGSLDQLITTKNLGYNKFKCITQNNHSSLRVKQLELKPALKNWLYGYPMVVKKLNSLVDIVKTPHKSNKNITLKKDGWEFNFGSSGPFGDNTDGEWQSFEEVVYAWCHYLTGRSKYGSPSLNIWHDIHATYS